MNIILFSKNRPAQLELLIRSMRIFFKEFSDFQIKILYKYTTENFKIGYDRTMKLHPYENMVWILENNFQQDLLQLFDKSKKYSVFFVDDIIIKEPFSIQDKEFKHFEKHGDILCLSLRLHPRLTYCYAARVNHISPIFDGNNVFLWKGQTGDYGYPMSLDGHIFRTKDLNFYMSNYLRYDGPNPLEAQMASQPLPHPKMICYDKSVLVNNPMNKVQEWNNNVHGNISAESINEQFLSGKIINLEPFIGIENKSCHQELPIQFI